ncbi:uncharacterized protein [Chelonus insularis]|uniref:uncharacterized protein n=1 Tax=Chelonus insularis TaxID=460826 RepID=UPI001588418C|nr:uncharacterized protein LOC118064161 [Chelonus insularis]
MGDIEKKYRYPTIDISHQWLSMYRYFLKILRCESIIRIHYSTDGVNHALEAIKNGVSLRRASALYHIPSTTLHRKLNKQTTTKEKPGPSTIFTKEEEKEIVEWILHRAQTGAPVTKTELFDSIQKYVQLINKHTPFINQRPGRHWYESFEKRHPNLTFRKPQHLSLTRVSVTREDLQQWFAEIEQYLRSKDLLNIEPSRIFNCDETSLMLCPDSERVRTGKGTRSVYRVVDAGKECHTVLFMYAASGFRAPPMLMFPYKDKLPQKIVKNTPSGWGRGISDNGWMTTETLYEYITNVFYPWLLQNKIQFPVIIYLDNHSSHMNIPLVSFCREKMIELIGFFPNSTHIVQPLDISFFHPFKEAWKKTVPKWKNKNNTLKIKKEEFPIVLKYTLDGMNEIEKKCIQSGFRGSGLYPFNPTAVDYDIFKK